MRRVSTVQMLTLSTNAQHLTRRDAAHSN